MHGQQNVKIQLSVFINRASQKQKESQLLQ